MPGFPHRRPFLMGKEATANPYTEFNTPFGPETILTYIPDDRVDSGSLLTVKLDSKFLSDIWV